MENIDEVVIRDAQGRPVCYLSPIQDSEELVVKYRKAFAFLFRVGEFEASQVALLMGGRPVERRPDRFESSRVCRDLLAINKAGGLIRIGEKVYRLEVRRRDREALKWRLEEDSERAVDARDCGPWRRPARRFGGGRR